MTVDVDHLLEQLGGYGRYQLLMFTALGLVYMRGAWQTFGIIFLAGTPSFHCSGSAGAPLNASLGDASAKCSVVPVNSTTNLSVPCHGGWVFGQEYGKTIVSEWDLVCDKEYLVELSTTIYMIGSALGGIFLMPLADRFGRKKIMLGFLWVQAVIGGCTALSPNYFVFTTLRFLVGMTNIAVGLTALVMMTEVFSSSCRALPSIAIQFFWAGGVMSLALFGYLVQDWRHLDLLISLPNFLFLPYCCLVPESLPWLISKKELHQAKRVTEKVCRINKISVPDDLEWGVENGRTALTSELGISATDAGSHPEGEGVGLLEPADGTENSASRVTSLATSAEAHHLENGNEAVQSLLPAPAGNGSITVVMNPRMEDAPKSPEEKLSSQSTEAAEESSILDLLRTPKIRRHSLIIFYLSLVCSLGYFGISFSTPTLHGNQYLNLFFSGAVEIPAYVVCMVVSNLIGRRIPLCVFLLLCGVMNIIAYAIPVQTDSGMNLSTMKLVLVMLGKFSITGAYTTIYLYSAEVFPTTIRNQAVGISSFFDSLGATAAPFIIYGAETNKQVALVMFGVMTALGGVAVLALPETHRRPLPQTIGEVEQWSQKQQ